MGLNFGGKPPALGSIKIEVPTPTYSGKSTDDPADSINPNTMQGPGPEGEGQTDVEIEEERNPPSGGPSGTELIPNMTSATSDGICTWSTHYNNLAGLEGWHCFDNPPPSTVEPFSTWLSHNSAGNEWVTYEFAESATVTPLSYTITSHDNQLQRSPYSWILEGWNGVGWDTLDTVTAQSAWGIYEVRAFDIDSPGAYNKFRFQTTAYAPGAANFVMVNQWQMSDQLS